MGVRYGQMWALLPELFAYLTKSCVLTIGPYSYGIPCSFKFIFTLNGQDKIAPFVNIKKLQHFYYYKNCNFLKYQNVETSSSFVCVFDAFVSPRRGNLDNCPSIKASGRHPCESIMHMDFHLQLRQHISPLVLFSLHYLSIKNIDLPGVNYLCNMHK